MSDPSSSDLFRSDLLWLGAVARALIGPAAADDLVQDTLVAALEGPAPAGSGRRPWLRSVAQRLAARRFRSAGRREAREADAARPEAGPDTADLVARAEAAEHLAAEVRALPEPYRRTLLLRFLEGRSTLEIAALEGSPVDTVRRRVRRGLELLREALARRDGRDGSAWCVALAPLAGSGATTTRVAVAAPSLAATVVAAMSMKPLLLALFAVVAVLAISRVALRDAPPVLPAEPERVVDARPLDAPSLPEVATRSAAVATRPADAGAPDARSTAAALRGVVVDEGGAPVAGASVFLVEPDPSQRGEGQLVAQATSATDGGFRLDVLAADAARERGGALELGVTANGYLRQVAPAPADLRRSGVRLVLERGSKLVGTVVDELGAPVPGLALLLFDVDSRVDHVSVSQVSLRASPAPKRATTTAS